MDNQLHSLSKIFTERLFRIPDYQRGYAWEEQQLKDFWGDLAQLEEDHNHYTGVLTLEEVEPRDYKKWDDDTWIITSKSFSPFYVVDGQQRLTTSIILVQCILERLEEEDKLNYTSREEIQKKFIFDSKDDGISRSYVFGYEKDNPSYEYLKGRIFDEFSSKNFEISETIYTNNLEFAKSFFSENLAGFEIEDLQLIYKKLTQNMLYNLFTIEEDVDVCVAFETMNNRGKALSKLELLKNRLIYLSLKLKAEENEKTTLRGCINDCWRTIYHTLGKNKDNPLEDDWFLRNHFLNYFGNEIYDVDGHEPGEPVSFRRLHHRQLDLNTLLLEQRFVTANIFSPPGDPNHIGINKIYEYVSSLQSSVESWFEIYNPFQSSLSDDEKIWLDKILRLNSTSAAPLLLAALQVSKNAAERVAILKAIERVLFVIYLRFPGYRFPGEELFVVLALRLSARKDGLGDTIKQIDSFAEKFMADAAPIKSVRAEFRRGGFYSWRTIRYFLYEYNLDLQSGSKTEREKILWPEFIEDQSDYITVEHIYPKNARHEYWKEKFRDMKPAQKRVLRDSLGNLLPLSKPKNSSLGNKPFPDKVKNPDGSTVGYAYGCYAENEVAGASDWTPQEILKRGVKMLEFMERRWAIRLGSEREKVEMLGLEFLRNPTKRKIPAKNRS